MKMTNDADRDNFTENSQSLIFSPENAPLTYCIHYLPKKFLLVSQVAG